MVLSGPAIWWIRRLISRGREGEGQRLRLVVAMFQVRDENVC
jgi:hypothetical protein